MAIIGSGIHSITAHGSAFRFRAIFTFDDGREIIKGPFNASSEGDADSKIAANLDRVFKELQESDADQAVADNVDTAYKQAALNQVRRAWLKFGYKEDEAHRAYYYMKKPATLLFSLPKTDQQLSNILDVPLSVLQKIKAKWQYLDANSSVILAYTSVQEGF
ncbi:MAG: hypothetical protein JKX91_06580 [Rhizobiaceae bacterium]|nr:hypothetical protein [Rhizobiaceae bacterium]